MRRILLSTLTVLLSLSIYAQSPFLIPYQAVVRNSGGAIVANQSVSFRFSIRDLTSNGTIVHQETNSTISTSQGLVNLNIGTGMVLIGGITSVNWSLGDKFLQVEMDINGGSSYVNMGTTQLASVPYALFARYVNADGVSGVLLNSNLPSHNGDVVGNNNTTTVARIRGVNVSTAPPVNSQVMTYNSAALNWEPQYFPGWNLTGNSGTVNSNFIGTTDPVALNFKVNDQKSGRIDFGAPNCTFFGYKAGNAAISTGTNNSAFGYNSQLLNQTGDFNTSFGEGTLLNNLSTSGNTAIGYNAMMNAYSVGVALLTYNTAVGYDALKGSATPANNTGDFNTAVGYNALTKYTSGATNAAFGAGSLGNTTTGTDNTACGQAALIQNVGGLSNTAVGKLSMQANVSGNYNSCVGASSVQSANASNLGVYIGYGAGNGFSAGDSNVFVGAVTQSAILTLNNSIAIGSNAIVTASRQARIGNQWLTSIGGYQNWSNVSDRRFKKDIRSDIPGLNFIMKLNPVSYNMDYASMNTLLGNAPADKAGDDMRHSGFIAQEVEEAAKKINYEFSGVDAPKNEKDFYALRYAEFVVPMVKAMQEQQLMIDEQKRQIEELKNAVEELKGMVQIKN